MVNDDQEVTVTGVEGVLVYKHAFDPDIFYYSSTRPTVGRSVFDNYAFTLLRYDQPVADRVGVLTFVVDLEPSQQDRERLQAELRRERPGAVLQPIPWMYGKVSA